MLKDEEALTVQRVRELLDYHPEKGLFTWRVKHGRNSDIGKRAGSKRGKYWQIYIDKKSYAEHRLAWLYVNGSWPTARYIDHINGDSRDNRIENLRECTNGQNMQNQRVAHRNSKTGFLGVQALGDGRYGAQITKDRTTHHLGVYSTPEAAHIAYVAAKEQLHEFGMLSVESVDMPEKRKKRLSKTGFSGVEKHPRYDRYRAFFYDGRLKKKIHVGYFDTPEEASRAREEARMAYIGSN